VEQPAIVIVAQALRGIETQAARKQEKSEHYRPLGLVGPRRMEPHVFWRFGLGAGSAGG
jgi:hypothetical protein